MMSVPEVSVWSVRCDLDFKWKCRGMSCWFIWFNLLQQQVNWVIHFEMWRSWIYDFSFLKNANEGMFWSEQLNEGKWPEWPDGAAKWARKCTGPCGFRVLARSVWSWFPPFGQPFWAIAAHIRWHPSSSGGPLRGAPLPPLIDNFRADFQCLTRK